MGGPFLFQENSTMSDKDEFTMIGRGLPAETAGGGPVYADSTLKAKSDLAHLDERARENTDSGPGVSLTPAQQLQLQVWQGVHYAASNAMLEASTRGDSDDAETAYKIMDLIAAQLQTTFKKIEDNR